MNSQIIIVGGGASGLMLAALLPPKSATIIDANPLPGAKIGISGGGKCNITNARMGTDYYVGESDFIAAVLKRFDEKALLQWLSRRGLHPVLRKTSQYFCPQSAEELRNLLLSQSRRQKWIQNEKVLQVNKRGEIFSVRTERRTLTASSVVVASGGLSFPRLGAGDIGYHIATHFGHTVTKTLPALVGLTVQREQFFFKALSGASTDVVITVQNRSIAGSLLFTHKGISGPAVLDASLYWEKGAITIDFLPGFDWKQMQGSRKHVSSLLPMPKRVTKAFLLQFGIDDQPASRLLPEQMQRLKQLKAYRFAPAGTFGYSRAEVTKGGVSTEAISAESMESRKVEGLYFTGEVVDVTGRVGGYNFQWAFSSAYCCAAALKRKEREE